MKIYVCTDHDGMYVGVASVVLANNLAEATTLLDAELDRYGLKGSEEHPYTLTKIPQTQPAAVVLQDGDY